MSFARGGNADLRDRLVVMAISASIRLRALSI
jgi:hypothetical protein